MASNPPLPRFGKYELIAHLATGGMAEIYLARQTGIAGFEKLLVIKRILPHLAREQLFVQMFFDEARIAAQLSHPNVVQIYELGCVDEQYFIAMEYLEGESLAEVSRQARKARRPISPVLSAGIIQQVCEGLHYAHGMVGPDGEPLQVIHRDINPQNIFILYTGGAKLVDFGIAKAAKRFSETSTGMLKGKYGYMSPEQIMNLPLDTRSDVFSLGVVLWELLTGRKLFRQSSELEILRAITEEDPPPPSTVNPAVSPELDGIAKKALCRSREIRYQTAGEMRLELLYFLKHRAEPSDTVAVGEFVQSLFADRMAQKRGLIKKAQSAGTDLGETLFGDLRPARSDTEPSISRETPSYPTSVPSVAGTPVPQATTTNVTSGGGWWKWLAVFSSVAVIGILALLLVKGNLLSSIIPGGGTTTGADAGSASVAVEPGTSVDAGLAPPQPPDEEAVPKSVEVQRPSQRQGGRGRPGQKKPVATADRRTGRLRLATNPWTTVYLGARKLGVTPLVDIELPAGKLTLRAVNEEKGIDRPIEVEIKPGETTVKTVRF